MQPFPPRMSCSIYEPQPISDRPVGLQFHTMGQGINPGDILFRPWVVGIVDAWMDSDPGMGSYRPRVTLTLCTSPKSSLISLY